MPNILITGAASGLGRAFLRYYIQQLGTASHPDVENNKIYAIDHSPAIHDIDSLLRSIETEQTQPEQLRKWVAKHVYTKQIDITDSSAVSTFFSNELDEVPLDIVIHSAGIRGLVDGGTRVNGYADVKNMENVEIMNAETMRKAFEVNVIGTFEVLRGCVPGLKKALGWDKGELVNGVEKEKQERSTMPRVVVMGSRMGSIANNDSGNANAGGAFAYRASKAALNAVVKSFSVDVPEVIWTVVHPGRVETGLVRVKEDGAMTVEDSVGIWFL